MGDDYYNPFTAIKPIPFWQIAAAFTAAVAAFLAFAWAATVVLLQIDQFIPWVKS